MKVVTGIFLGSLQMIVLLCGCSTMKFTPGAHEEFYGTWINEKLTPQKYIDFPTKPNGDFNGGFKGFAVVSDTDPSSQGVDQITSKWKDSDGTIWYKTLAMATAGDPTGHKWQTLVKISKDGKVREMVLKLLDEFDPDFYPTQIDPTDPRYSVYYRADD